MKQLIDQTQWKELSPSEADFILLWKRRKYNDVSPTLNLGQVMELIIATAYNLHFEESDGRFFNNALINEESLIAWDGTELIDILWFEAIRAVKHRLSTTKTFPEE